MLSVCNVNNHGRGMADFIDLPYRLYRHDPRWCPPLRLERRHFFSRKNPFLHHCEVAYFVAYDKGRPVGRVTAHEDQGHNRHYRTRQGFFGFFECVPELAVARALMHRAGAWAKDRGLDSLIGPMNFSTKHEIGFLTEGFEHRPVFLMPYTKPYYPGYLGALGYAPVKQLVSYRIDLQTPIPATLSRVARRAVAKHGDSIFLRTIDMKHLRRELDIILDIYNDAWDGNWGFIPLTPAEIDDMAALFARFAEPSFVYLLFKDDRPAAFFFPLPDINEVLGRIADGRLLPLGWLELLRWRHRVTTGSVILMGVKSAYRNQGLDLILYQRLAEDARRQGRYQSLETTWILSDNHPMTSAMDFLNASLHNRYVVLEKRPL